MPDRKRIPLSHYLSPRYWPTWCLLGMMRLCASLPFSLQLFLGRQLGMIVYALMPERRKIAKINIDLCFPSLSLTEKNKIVKDCFRNLGVSIFEVGLSWWGSTERLDRLHSVEGLEHLQAARAAGKNIILLSGHFSCTEIGGRLIAMHTPFQALYKRSKNKLFQAAMLNARNRLYAAVIDNKETRLLIKGLKNKIATWYAPDQYTTRGEKVFAPFFNIPTITLTTGAKLAKLADATVLPFFPYRLPGNQGYKIIIKAPLENFPSGDALADATLINKAIEDAIREYPDQYLWVHKRFKNRPEGETQFY